MRTFIVVLMFSLGCGSGVAIDDLPGAFVGALCDRFVRCGVVESHDACGDLLDGIENFAELQHAVDNGTVRYDADAMGECFDAFASASCDQTSESARVDSPACFDAIRGTVPDDGACMIGSQCISRRCNNPSCPMACCEGTCAPTVPDAPIDAACLPGTINCVDGAFCNASRICQALLAAGESCITNNQCGYGLYCPSGTRRCTDAQNRGDPCPDRSCADLGTTCDANQVCSALARKGEACAVASGCQIPNVCNPVTLVCDPPPTIDQMCTATCAAGAYCDQQTGRCAAEKANDQPCISSSECLSRFCDDITSTCTDEPTCI